jgi:predicted enzyme related to lactoylglutathione lyase
MLGAALGKELRERDGAPDGPHFSGRAGDLMLSVHPSKEPYAELALLVADLDHAIEVCAERGSRVVSGPAAEPYGRVAHMAGPGGLRVELVQAANTKS